MTVEQKGQMPTIPSSGLAINVVGYGAGWKFPNETFYFHWKNINSLQLKLCQNTSVWTESSQPGFPRCLHILPTPGWQGFCIPCHTRAQQAWRSRSRGKCQENSICISAPREFYNCIIFTRIRTVFLPRMQSFLQDKKSKTRCEYLLCE